MFTSAVENLLLRMASNKTDQETMLRVMARFVSLLYHITGRLGPGTPRELPPERILAFALVSNPQFLDPTSRLGIVMAMAVVLECVRQCPDVTLGLAKSRRTKSGEMDVMPIFQTWPMKRMTRALNMTRHECNLISAAGVPLYIMRNHLPRLVSNVFGTYDLAARSDRDVPSGLCGVHVELLVRSMTYIPDLVAHLVHRTMATSTPASRGSDEGCRQFLQRFQRSVRQGLTTRPRESDEGVITTAEVFGPARFSRRSVRDKKFVEMATTAIRHIAPGSDTPEWEDYEPDCGIVTPPKFDPSWLVSEFDPNGDGGVDEYGDEPHNDDGWFA